jgi:hypothetical protein
MLLEMPWLDRYRPRVEFRPARLFHPKDYDPIERVEPVSLDELVEGGEPIFVASVTVSEELLTMDLDLQSQKHTVIWLKPSALARRGNCLHIATII